MTRRIGFSRLETDAEPLARVRAKHPHAVRMTLETVDAFADRHGVWRRIVENVAAVEVKR